MTKAAEATAAKADNFLYAKMRSIRTRTLTPPNADIYKDGAAAHCNSVLAYSLRSLASLHRSAASSQASQSRPR